MGKKKKLKAIKALANKLPYINDATHEVHRMKGSEILAWGTITHIEGVRIDPDKIYSVPFPVNIVRNNQRRIKKAFLKHGAAGIGHLLADVNKIREHNYKNQ
jgi:hypothetical protein